MMLIKKTSLNFHLNKHSRKNIIIALCLVAALLVTGAFAYLTDKDQATNTFTVGDVKIDLKEPSWSESNATDIWAGKVMSKDPQVKNTGDNDAFIYVMVTVPKADGIMVFDQAKGKAMVENYQLFTYNLNAPIADPATAGWTLIDSKIDVDDTNNYYLYAYSAALIPGATTIPVFNKITFANVIEDQFTEPNNELNVIVDAYAIQSNFGNNSANAKPEDVWNRYVNQNGWDWPSVPAPNFVTYLNLAGEPIARYVYKDPAKGLDETSEFSISATPTVGDNEGFAGWMSQSKHLYQNNDIITAEDLYIRDKTGKILNVNPTLKEVTKYSDPDEGTKKIRLIPKTGSTTIIDRGGHSVDDYTTDSEWYVYGLEEYLTDTILLDKYIDVEGDGRIEIEYIYFDGDNQCYSNNRNDAWFKGFDGNVYVGTGTIINVYDRNGTKYDTTDDTLVESFKIIIFGDINGDAVIRAVDSTMVDNEVSGVTNWSKRFDENNVLNPEYNNHYTMAANLDNDKAITSLDAAMIDCKTLGIATINQTTGEYTRR